MTRVLAGLLVMAACADHGSPKPAAPAPIRRPAAAHLIEMLRAAGGL